MRGGALDGTPPTRDEVFTRSMPVSATACRPHWFNHSQCLRSMPYTHRPKSISRPCASLTIPSANPTPRALYEFIKSVRPSGIKYWKSRMSWMILWLWRCACSLLPLSKVKDDSNVPLTEDRNRLERMTAALRRQFKQGGGPSVSCSTLWAWCTSCPVATMSRRGGPRGSRARWTTRRSIEGWAGLRNSYNPESVSTAHPESVMPFTGARIAF
jgi:hypothetical protein